MQYFFVSDAVRFKFVTQQEDNKAKVQVFLGVFLGVILRWIYGVAIVVIKTGGAWDFGPWHVILARIVVALIATFFVFSGYWQKVKDIPPSWRFWTSLSYGISIDVIVGPWIG